MSHRFEEPRFCAIYRREATLYFSPGAMTKAGWWLTCAPILTRSAEGDLEALGTAAIESLDRSVHGVDPPVDLSKHVRQILRPLSLRSWKSFAGGAMYVSVVREAHEVHLRGQQLSKSGSTRDPRATEKVMLADADVRGIGAAILQLSVPEALR